MQLFFYTVLGVFGLLFGSFASVVIHRLKSGEKGICTGRSHCGKCKHQLHTRDLFPIFSYLFGRGKCRYCKSKIPFVYPLLEIVMALSFVGVGVWIVNFETLTSSLGTVSEGIKLITFLILTFCSVVYVFYDIMYMEIPESVLAVANIIALSYLFYIAFSVGGFSLAEVSIFSTLVIGIFAVLYAIMIQEKEEKIDLLLLGSIGCILVGVFHYFGIHILSFPPLEGILASYMMFIFFYFQYYVSGGRWIGGGDFRIAVLMGLMLGFSHLFIGFLATYICGSVVGISLLSYKYLKTKKLEQNMKIAFGPFLAFGIYFALFFGDAIKSLIF